MAALGAMYWHVSEGVEQAAGAFEAHQRLGALSIWHARHHAGQRRARAAAAQADGARNPAAASVHAAASEIATGTDDLSGRTEDQARQLQEVASVLAKLGDAVRENAVGAGRVTAATGSALSAARGGSAVVGQSVEGMAEIREASAAPPTSPA